MMTVLTTLPPGWRLEVRGPTNSERRAYVSLVSPDGKQGAFMSGSAMLCELVEELEADTREHVVNAMLRDVAKDEGAKPD